MRMKGFLKFHQLDYKIVLNDFHPNSFPPQNHDQEQTQTLLKLESVVPQQSHHAVVGHLVFRNPHILSYFRYARFSSS